MEIIAGSSQYCSCRKRKDGFKDLLQIIDELERVGAEK